MKKITYITLLLFVMTISSCKDWLTIYPDDQITKETLIETGEGYRIALNGLYREMGSAELYGTELQYGMIDCMSQQYNLSEWINSDEASREAGKFNFKNVQVAPKIEKIWLKGYKIIANANSIISSIKDESPNIFLRGEVEKKMIEGEAYACRAFMHFDLLRLFAPAPINDDGGKYIPYVDVTPNISAQGVGVQDVLNRVIEDFEYARKLVQAFDTTDLGKSVLASGNARFRNQLEYGMEAYSNQGAVDGFFNSRGFRLNYYAITALLARVYQYAGNGEKAIEYSKLVLEAEVKSATSGSKYELFSRDNFQFAWNDDPNTRKDIKVTSNLIFAINNNNAEFETEVTTFFNKKNNQTGRNNWFALNMENQKIFYSTSGKDEKDGDIRYKWMTWLANGQNVISGKFYISDNDLIKQENISIFPIIRSTELKYIMAEEYARQGNYDEAYKILNAIRDVRQASSWETPLEKMPVASDFNQFKKDLIRDAQREWISEGQLYYLYKRLNADVIIDNNSRPLNRSEYMLPIPISESL